LEIGRHDYGGLGIIACPEWHSPAVFIAWIEENISPRQEQRYPADALSLQMTTRIFELHFCRSELDLSGRRRS